MEDGVWVAEKPYGRLFYRGADWYFSSFRTVKMDNRLLIAGMLLSTALLGVFAGPAVGAQTDIEPTEDVVGPVTTLVEGSEDPKHCSAEDQSWGVGGQEVSCSDWLCEADDTVEVYAKASDDVTVRGKATCGEATPFCEEDDGDCDDDEVTSTAQSPAEECSAESDEIDDDGLYVECNANFICPDQDGCDDDEKPPEWCPLTSPVPVCAQPVPPYCEYAPQLCNNPPVSVPWWIAVQQAWEVYNATEDCLKGHPDCPVTAGEPCDFYPAQPCPPEPSTDPCDYYTEEPCPPEPNTNPCDYVQGDCPPSTDPCDYYTQEPCPPDVSTEPCDYVEGPCETDPGQVTQCLKDPECPDVGPEVEICDTLGTKVCQLISGTPQADTYGDGPIVPETDTLDTLTADLEDYVAQSDWTTGSSAHILADNGLAVGAVCNEATGCVYVEPDCHIDAVTDWLHCSITGTAEA